MSLNYKKANPDESHFFQTLARKIGIDDISIPFRWIWKIVAVVFAAGVAWATIYNNVSILTQKTVEQAAKQRAQDIQIYVMNNKIDSLESKIDKIMSYLGHSPKNSPLEAKSLNTTEFSYYTVQEGESLWDVAKKLHVSPDSLIQANPNLLDPGTGFGSGLVLKYQKPS
jgi:hypothetical protein